MTGLLTGISVDECPNCSQVFLQVDIKASRCFTVEDVKLEEEILCCYLWGAFLSWKCTEVESNNTVRSLRLTLSQWTDKDGNQYFLLVNDRWYVKKQQSVKGLENMQDNFCLNMYRKKR